MSLVLDCDNVVIGAIMTDEMPSTITISSTATGATGDAIDDRLETDSGDNVQSESLELASRDN